MANNQQNDLSTILTPNRDSNKNIVVEKTESNKDRMGRVPKDIKYTKERKELVDKLLNILGITDTNKIFYVDELDGNEAKQKQILDLVHEVKQYFTYGGWVYFAKNNVPDPCLSLTKSILRDSGYTLSPFYPKENNSKTKRKAIIIEKK
ncbi:hypothetical protein Catovirus_1_103 [Catovirus CTV1]|uniref:Uncharacterized protein n=1 Tax=Catovirus CTV1 TaxID=1977631 RepID=A0A1V0S8L7_9VIRU|nr:hypothetical protein Catovirus_1_103 [Catovirus CTV1]